MKLGTAKNKIPIVLAFAAMFVFQAWNALGDYTTGTVSGLTAKQRYPWNGLVDISFTLSGPESRYCIAVTAIKTPTSPTPTGTDYRRLLVRTLRDKVGKTIDASTAFAPGAVSIVWDADRDASSIAVKNLTLSVATAPPPPSKGIQLWEGGPYWADRNLGARWSSEYGLYFWWGDTIGRRLVNNAWVTSDGLETNCWSCSGDGLAWGKSPSTLQSEGWITWWNALEEEHDAAQVQWGGGWRMPTKGDFDDLISKCDWTWTDRGCVIRGRGSYWNASIFLPAGGEGSGAVTNGIIATGSIGCYWSSVPCSGDGTYRTDFTDGRYHSWCLSFTSDGPKTDWTYSAADRGAFLAVRPVRDPQ